MSIYIAHYRTVPLMCSVHRVLLKKSCRQQATEDGKTEVWVAQIVAQWVPDHRTNHGKWTTAINVELHLWHNK